MKSKKSHLILGLLFLTAQGLASSSYAAVKTPMGPEQAGPAANSNNDRQMQSDTLGSRKSTNFNTEKVNPKDTNTTTTYREEKYDINTNRGTTGVAGTTRNSANTTNTNSASDYNTAPVAANDQYAQANMDRNMEQRSAGMSPLGIGLLVLLAIALIAIGSRAYARRSQVHPVA